MRRTKLKFAWVPTVVEGHAGNPCTIWLQPYKEHQRLVQGTAFDEMGDAYDTSSWLSIRRTLN
jgi:hypothetical protein